MTWGRDDLERPSLLRPRVLKKLTARLNFVSLPRSTAGGAAVNVASVVVNRSGRQHSGHQYQPSESQGQEET